MTAVRNEGCTDALTPNAVLTIEVQLPPIVHKVPLKAGAAMVAAAEH